MYCKACKGKGLEKREVREMVKIPPLVENDDYIKLENLGSFSEHNDK